MSSNTTECPHCKGPRDPDLVPGNYLCRECVERATDALGWPVAVATELDAAGLPTKLLAVHEDWTQCVDVGTRCRAYVDDIAFRVLPGEPGEAFLQPLAVSEPLGTKTKPGPEDTAKFWELVHVVFNVDVQELRDGEFIYIDYETGKRDRVYGILRPVKDGFHLEVVSNQLLHADDWPLDVEYLEDHMWSPPDPENPCWYQFVVGSSRATGALLDGLRWGRACEDPFLLGWEARPHPGPTAGGPPW